MNRDLHIYLSHNYISWWWKAYETSNSKDFHHVARRYFIWAAPLISGAASIVEPFASQWNDRPWRMRSWLGIGQWTVAPAAQVASRSPSSSPSRPRAAQGQSLATLTCRPGSLPGPCHWPGNLAAADRARFISDWSIDRSVSAVQSSRPGRLPHKHTHVHVRVSAVRPVRSCDPTFESVVRLSQYAGRRRMIDPEVLDLAPPVREAQCGQRRRLVCDWTMTLLMCHCW